MARREKFVRGQKIWLHVPDTDPGYTPTRKRMRVPTGPLPIVVLGYTPGGWLRWNFDHPHYLAGDNFISPPKPEYFKSHK